MQVILEGNESDKCVSTLQMDYRSLVHDKDVAIFSEIRVIVLDIRGFYVSWTGWFWLF